jgi:hypothetical protein
VILTRYTSDQAGRWNQFVRTSKNGTFLFDRGYMDYHEDRFEDHSLVVTDNAGRLIALLPAHEAAGRLVSHGGLTYGGVVTDCTMSTPAMLALFDALREYMRECGLASLRYKAVPRIYHRYPADEDLYALFRHGARVCRVDVLSTIAMRAGLPFQERRRRQIRKAEQAGLRVEKSDEFGEFWEILENNLRTVHGVNPVHTVGEIRLLHERFPAAISLYVCRDGGAMVAGVLIYDSPPMVAHVQYASSTPRGRDVGAMDHLLSQVIKNAYADREYFDLGASTEHEGTFLNVGLVEQKEGFGARCVTQQFFELTVNDPNVRPPPDERSVWNPDPQ